MAKEQSAKTVEKKQAKVNPAQPMRSGFSGLAVEGLPIPAALSDVPLGLRPQEVMRRQHTQGNLFVQRSLARQVIQRQPGGGVGGAPMPIMPTHESRTVFAVFVLKNAYGGRIKSETKVNGVANEAAVRAEYDRSMIAQGKKIKDKDAQGNEILRDWKNGDTYNHPDMKTEFAGFRDTSNGQIYVDTSKPADEQTATIAHEMLHASSSGSIVGAFGKGLDEGITEKLTIDAFAKSGINAKSGMYQEWVTFANRLGAAFGDGALIDAYFGNLESLRSAINERLGRGTYFQFAEALKAGNFAAVNDIINRGIVAAVENLLSGWVSDEDLDNLEEIYNSVSGDERARIQPIIQAAIPDLWSIGQRTRLRLLLAKG
jgi:hypothetical protein